MSWATSCNNKITAIKTWITINEIAPSQSTMKWKYYYIYTQLLTSIPPNSLFLPLHQIHLFSLKRKQVWKLSHPQWRGGPRQDFSRRSELQLESTDLTGWSRRRNSCDFQSAEPEQRGSVIVMCCVSDHSQMQASVTRHVSDLQEDKSWKQTEK